MPTKSASSRDLAAKIDEIKQKLILLEGDRRAHAESSENVMKENREKISLLMEENKNLRKKLSKQNKGNGTEKQIVIGEDTNGDLKNKLNLLRYETKKREKQLRDIQKQNNVAQNKDNSDGKDKQAARDLENRLDKTNLKQKEAEHIHRTYQQIRSKLEDEHKTYETQLDEIQQEIKRMKSQMKELRAMNSEAISSRDHTRKELERREKEVYAGRRRMELEMQKVKREAEEKRALHNQLANKRQEVRHGEAEEGTEEERQRSKEDEEEESLRNYENFFRVIKEATGVSDTQEVVIRFELQSETRDQLSDLKRQNDQTIADLSQQKEALNARYDELIYSADNLTERKSEYNSHSDELTKEKERKIEAEKKLKRSTQVLIDAKSGIDHLEEKLQPIKLDESVDSQTKESARSVKSRTGVAGRDAARGDGDAADGEERAPTKTRVGEELKEDYDEQAATTQVEKESVEKDSAIRKLETCEKKLLMLMNIVEKEVVDEGKDVKQVCKEMEELEFQLASQIQLPTHNTRILMADDTKETTFAEDNQSGEDDEILTREKLKKQSQSIVDSKNKRMIGKRKKKTK